jgi:hypothetical protein
MFGAALVVAALAATAPSPSLPPAAPAPESPAVDVGGERPNPYIDPEEFLRLAERVVAARDERRLSESSFARLALRPGTVVLDARSHSFFEQLHLRGARSLPYTEFTAETLARIVPDFDTPILIYCNNNFVGAENEFATKAPPAALNLATWVSLYAYGYENVWELAPLVDIRATKLQLAGENAADYARPPRS